MPLVTNEEIRNRLRTTIPMQAPYQAAETQKFENIASLNALSREGLVNGFTERRIHLYETRCGEKVYMQYPGIESTREGHRSE